MVLTRAEKDEFVELINNTLKTYLSSLNIGEKLLMIDSISDKLEQSLKVITDRYDTRIKTLEEEKLKLQNHVDKLEQYSRRNCILMKISTI